MKFDGHEREGNFIGGDDDLVVTKGRYVDTLSQPPRRRPTSLLTIRFATYFSLWSLSLVDVRSQNFAKSNQPTNFRARNPKDPNPSGYLHKSISLSNESTPKRKYSPPKPSSKTIYPPRTHARVGSQPADPSIHVQPLHQRRMKPSASFPPRNFLCNERASSLQVLVATSFSRDGAIIERRFQICWSSAF